MLWGTRLFSVIVLTFSLAAHAVDPLASLDLLEPTIADCVARADNPQYPVFHGCWDWHSAAHAHWALFRIARARGTDSAATLDAERSLSPRGLAGEMNRLRRQFRFENPYGRAWFLRLVIDFEAWAASRAVSNQDRLRPLGELVAGSLREWYRQHPPGPNSGEYDNASWAFAQLHAYFTHTGDRESLAAVDAVIRRDFLGATDRLSFADDKIEFFSRYGNWAYLVARTQPANALARFLSDHPIGSSLDPIPPTPGVSHSLGLNWSRAWALAALRGRIRDPQARRVLAAAIDAHVAQGLNDHEKYKEDYLAYGHWVSQFAVYALTEGLGL